MTALTWDNPGEHVYQTGVDRGVLFLQDGTIVPWNGLTGVEDTTAKETNDFYLDGVKYLEYVSPGDFSANLKAFTYPDEFDDVNGIFQYGGVRYHDQPPKTFSLSYRTLVGDDVDGLDAGYFIHLIYNVIANPDSHESPTLNDSPQPTEFSWVLSARPVRGVGFWRPTAHVSLDSRWLNSEQLQNIEDAIYGTAETDPSLPAMADLAAIISG